MPAGSKTSYVPRLWRSDSTNVATYYVLKILQYVRYFRLLLLPSDEAEDAFAEDIIENAPQDANVEQFCG